MVRSIIDFLINSNTVIRFTALWLFCLFIFFVSWSFGYYFLPNRILANILPSGRVGLGSDNLWLVFAHIFFYNLIFAGGIMVFANLFRIGQLPLGYIPIVAQWTGFGFFFGTNSFSIPLHGRVAPSLKIFLASPGALELTALTLLVSSTAGLYMFRQVSWTDRTTYRIRALANLHLGTTEIFLIITSILLLAIGN